jgi:hypothetical protein
MGGNLVGKFIPLKIDRIIRVSCKPINKTAETD